MGLSICAGTDKPDDWHVKGTDLRAIYAGFYDYTDWAVYLRCIDSSCSFSEFRGNDLHITSPSHSPCTRSADDVAIDCTMNYAIVQPLCSDLTLAVRCSRQHRQGKTLSPHGYRKATVRPPYVALWCFLWYCCGCWKRLNVMFKISWELWELQETKSLRTPYG